MQQLSKILLQYAMLAGLALYLVAQPALSKEAVRPAAKIAPKILVVGDSISAEYGLKRGTGWVALLENRMAESVNIENKGKSNPVFTIINASISGDTTSGGRSRLTPLLDMHRPTHVIIELGANDALRGLPITMTEDNLNAMTQTALKSGAKVLLLGMQIPPNYGADYTKQFNATFAKVARANKSGGSVGFVPFILAGVADSPDYSKLFQADRIHPAEAAHPRILANIWPELQKQLK